MKQTRIDGESNIRHLIKLLRVMKITLLLLVIALVRVSASSETYDSHGKSFSVQQQETVTGKVIDRTGEGIPGATIVWKGTNTGTVSDFDGNFTLTRVPNNTTLVFSFIGMKTKEVVNTTENNIRVTLEDEDIALEELVVTALNISREKKSLGYAVQDVSGDRVVQAKELNVANALAGKVSGVHVTQGGGGLGGGGSRIIIRGETSLAGNNTPMAVIDGVPGGMNDVAPEDIESISVLKGPAAAALYGSRAGAGVIIITTKKGSMDGGLNVELNSSMSFQNPLVLPDVQSEYGQGSGGQIGDFGPLSWGPKFENQTVEQLWGSNVWQSHPNNIKNFYNTGSILTNNVSISGNDKTSTFRLSFTNVLQKGMIPNTKYDENRFDLTAGRTFLDGLLDVKANVKYAVITNDNNQSIDPMLWPTNVDLNVMKDYWMEKGVEQRLWMNKSQQINNPYFDLYENTNWSQANRYHGNLSFTFNFTKSLNLLLRSGINGDFHESRHNRQFTSLGANNQYGGFRTNFSKGYEMNNDFLLKYNTKFGSDFSMVAMVGGNMMSSNGSNLSGESSQLLIPNVYNTGNYRTYPYVSNSYDNHTKINALYGALNLGYKDLVYLDITGRNDWTSTLLYKVNDSYFYPSASLSMLLNNMIDMSNNVDLLKIKGNYAAVGKSIDRFQLDPFYYFTRGSDGIAGIEEGGVKSYRDLKPEFTNSFEVGVEGTFFKNRLNVDLTYYNTVTKNQIWNMNVSSVSGYQQVIRNIGKVSSNGLELTLNAIPIKVGKFQWNSTINWSMDRTKVTELDPDNPGYSLSKHIGENLYSYDTVGERKGAIQSRVARRFQYDPSVHDSSLAGYDGELFFDKNKDLPRAEQQVIGYYNPDWIGSFYNELRWGNFSVSALLFANVGNSVFNKTQKDLVKHGLDKMTLQGRESGVLPEGVWESPDGIRPFAPGDEINGESYWGDYMVDGELGDLWVQDGSFLKLKEMNIGYTLPKSLLQNTLLEKVAVSITGRNLALWTKAKHIDPETYLDSEVGLVPGVSRPGGIPSARTYTLNLNIHF